MGFQRMLVQAAWVGVVLSVMAAADTQFPLALPNCADRCGDVEIPYPFGLAEGCYLNGSGEFSIDCDYSSGKPKPKTGAFFVTNISIQAGEIDIMMNNAIDCYSRFGNRLNNTMWQRGLTNPIFTISDTKNKFVAIGCDTYAYLQGVKNNERFSSGCLSVCESKSNVVSGNCSGIGCCQMDIPGGLKNITLEANSFKYHREVWSFNPCSFAFVIREDKFTFSSEYLTTMVYNKTLPMVLDWAIGSEKCDLARNKSNYVCGENSTCVNSRYGSGYRCECSKGYRGNPYLKHGCQGIQFTYYLFTTIFSGIIKHFLTNF